MNWRSLYLSMIVGRANEAITVSRRAVELDPLSASSLLALQVAFIQQQRYDEAIACCRQALDMDPTLWVSRRALGIALTRVGKYDEAKTELARVVRETNGVAMAVVDLIIAHASTGERETAEAMLEELVTRERTSYVQPAVIANGFAAVNRLDEAFAWLERAYRERDAMLPLLNHWTVVPALRRDPRLRAIITRVGLEPAPDLA